MELFEHEIFEELCIYLLGLNKACVIGPLSEAHIYNEKDMAQKGFILTHSSNVIHLPNQHCIKFQVRDKGDMRDYIKEKSDFIPLDSHNISKIFQHFPLCSQEP